MFAKFMILTIAAIMGVSSVNAGSIGYSATVVAPYATSYNAHQINHGYAAPAFAAYSAVPAAYSAYSAAYPTYAAAAYSPYSPYSAAYATALY